MDTKNNNVAINEFSGGMNSDLSYSMLQPKQYVYGKNIRLTSNSLLLQEELPDKKEGAVSLIPEGILKFTYTSESAYFKDVLATAQIDNICVIIIKTIRNTWCVYRITDNNIITATKIFDGADVGDTEKFSVVINKEITGVIKLYISDGQHQVMMLNVNQEYDQYNLSIPDATYLISNSYFPASTLNIVNKISGRLPVGQVQYTYRFYKKYGIKSRLAPLTNKIQIFDPDRNREEGNAEGTISSVGLQLQAWCDQLCFTLFDRIQIFRLYYKHPNTDADIELIYDKDLTSGKGIIKVNDIGQDPLKVYTAEEFSLLDGQIIIPKVIEQNQGHMFAANVKDETIFYPEKNGFDARSYSINKNNNVVLYHNEDTQYQLNPVSASVYTTIGSGSINIDGSTYSGSSLHDVDYQFDRRINPQLYTLNKFADLNRDTTQEEIPPCRYSMEMFSDVIDNNTVSRHILGGSGKYVDWRFITTHIPIHSATNVLNQLPPAKENFKNSKICYITPKYISGSGENHQSFEPKYFRYGWTEEGDQQTGDVPHQFVQNFGGQTTDSYFQQHGILADQNISYDDMFTSSMLRSLRRDEVYRYGIVLYDKSGKKSDVYWIADIRTPSNSEFDLISNQVLDDISEDASIQSYQLSTTYRQDAHRRKSSQDGVTYTYTNTIQSQNFNVAAGEHIYVKNTSSVASVDIEEQYEYYLSGNSGQTALRTVFQVPQIVGTLDEISDRVNSRLASVRNSVLVNKLRNFSITLNSVKIRFEQDNIIKEVDANTYNSDRQYYGVNRNVQVIVEYTQSFDITSTAYRILADTYLKINVFVATNDPTSTYDTSSSYCARPIGIEFKVHNLPNNVIGYQIVRCSKDEAYRKNIMQCVTARPARQLLYREFNPRTDEISSERYSPYYPSYVLTSNSYYIVDKLTNTGLFCESIYNLLNRDSDDNITVTQYRGAYCDAEEPLFQIYSPEITFRRDDTLQLVQNAETASFTGFYYLPATLSIPGTGRDDINSGNSTGNGNQTIYGANYIRKDNLAIFEGIYQTGVNFQRNKITLGLQYCYYNYISANRGTTKINQIKDVKNPLWYDAYSNVQLGATNQETNVAEIASVTKQYQSFVTPIGDKEYLNWICSAMYGIKAFSTDINADQSYNNVWQLFTKEDLKSEPNRRVSLNTGFIGPGPICFVMNTKDGNVGTYDEQPFGSAVVNLQHKAVQYSGLSNAEKTFDVYYGFGNFKNITNGSSTEMVFDGDVYIVPFEIVQMFKAYDFNSADTLQSAQFVYYVPIESTINTLLDYGMNWRNTYSKNLQLEPGEITGVSVQDRPIHQYNSIMSDNSTSNDVYNARSSEYPISEFNQRIFFSDQKISGEHIDNWLNFAPLNYIDVDSRYGNITCLYSMKDAIYCWQDRSFGRISVKERSLVADTNNNMVQLGQGGVMQRIDYIDTNHGMSADQYVCTSADGKIYWIDDKNKAIFMSDGQGAINLSERTQVQSILNHKFYNKNMSIDHDDQTDELLCKCLQNGNQLVFNTKLEIATAEYTRKYDDVLLIGNSLYGITTKFEIYQYNNLTKDEIANMMPASITFVVNNNASITKVFDNQEIVLSNVTDEVNDFSHHTEFTYNTNLDDMYYNGKIESTSREGNLQYSIPRSNNADYGQRMRGKWLKVKIDNDGKITNSISHIITKFRQSF